MRFADPLKSRIRNAELLVFEGGAHATLYERVAEFNDKTLAFLRRHAGAAVALSTGALRSTEYAPRLIKGSPIILDLSEAGGGQLLVGNITNDNKLFLEGMSANGEANDSELLITGRFITSLPLVSVLADISRILGRLQIGEGFNPGFTVSPSDASPNAGYIRLGDQTRWKLHIGRTRETNAGPVNTGTAGVLMTIQDNGHVGIGTQQPTERLAVDGNLVVTGDTFLKEVLLDQAFSQWTDGARWWSTNGAGLAPGV
jgi:hypothetical protein